MTVIPAFPKNPTVAMPYYASNGQDENKMIFAIFLKNLLQAVLNPVDLQNLRIGKYGCYPKVHSSFQGNSNLEFGCNFHQGRSNIGGHRDLNFFQKIVLKSEEEKQIKSWQFFGIFLQTGIFKMCLIIL